MHTVHYMALAALLIAGASCNDGSNLAVARLDAKAPNKTTSATLTARTPAVEAELADIDAGLSAKGFHLLAGDIANEGISKGVSRYTVQLVGSTGEPIAGGALVAKRIAGSGGALRVETKLRRLNPGNNVFTLFVESGSLYELSADAAGYLKNSRSLLFDATHPLTVSVPLTLQTGEDGDSGLADPTDLSPAVLPDETPQSTRGGLAYCDVSSGDLGHDLRSLVEMLRALLPALATELETKHIASGHELAACDASAYPQVTLTLATAAGETAAFVIADAAALEGHWYRDQAVAFALAPNALFSRGGRGAQEIKGQYNADTFWFELDKDLTYLVVDTGLSVARQFFAQKPEGKQVIDSFVRIARETLALTSGPYDEAKCYGSAEAIGIAFHDISNDPTKERPSATAAYLGDTATGWIFASGNLAGCQQLDAASFEAFVTAIRKLVT